MIVFIKYILSKMFHSIKCIVLPENYNDIPYNTIYVKYLYLKTVLNKLKNKVKILENHNKELQIENQIYYNKYNKLVMKYNIEKKRNNNIEETDVESIKTDDTEYNLSLIHI